MVAFIAYSERPQKKRGTGNEKGNRKEGCQGAGKIARGSQNKTILFESPKKTKSGEKTEEKRAKARPAGSSYPHFDDKKNRKVKSKR